VLNYRKKNDKGSLKFQKRMHHKDTSGLMKATYHKTLIFLLFFVTFNTLSAQQSLIVRGRVYDKSDNTALIGATAIEYDKDDRVLKGTITDVNGDFVLEMSSLENT
jgi:ribosomal protein L35AE/L33A